MEVDDSASAIPEPMMGNELATPPSSERRSSRRSSKPVTYGQYDSDLPSNYLENSEPIETSVESKSESVDSCCEFYDESFQYLQDNLSPVLDFFNESLKSTLVNLFPMYDEEASDYEISFSLDRSGMTAGILSVWYESPKGKKYRNRIEVAGALGIVKVARNGRPSTREAEFLIAQEFRQRILLSHLLLCRPGKFTKIVYEEDNFRIYDGDVELEISDVSFAFGNITVLDWGRIVVSSSYHDINRLYPVGFKCLRQEVDSKLDRVIDCYCEIVDPLDAYDNVERTQSQGPLFRVTVCWENKKGEFINKFYETMSPHQAWQAVLLENDSFENVDPALLNSSASHDDDPTDMESADEEEISLRETIIQQRKAYYRALKNQQTKGKQEAIAPRLVMEGIDGYFDDFLVQMIEGMSGSEKCKMYQFYESRKEREGAKKASFMKPYFAMLRKCKILLKSSKKMLGGSRKRRSEGGNNHNGASSENGNEPGSESLRKRKRDSKSQAGVMQKARNVRLRKVDSSITTYRNNLPRILKRRREETNDIVQSYAFFEEKELLERNQHANHQQSSNHDCDGLHNSNSSFPLPIHSQFSSFFDPALLPMVLETWDFFQCFHSILSGGSSSDHKDICNLDMCLKSLLRLDPVIMTIVNHCPELRCSLTSADPTKLCPGLTSDIEAREYLEELGVALTKPFLKEYERIMGIESLESSSNRIPQVPVNVLTWREVARVVLMDSFYRSCSLHTVFDLTNYLKPRPFLWTPDPHDRKALKLIRKRILHGHSEYYDAITHLSSSWKPWSFESGLIIRIPMPCHSNIYGGKIVSGNDPTLLFTLWKRLFPFLPQINPRLGWLLRDFFYIMASIISIPSSHQVWSEDLIRFQELIQGLLSMTPLDVEWIRLCRDCVPLIQKFIHNDSELSLSNTCESSTLIDKSMSSTFPFDSYYRYAHLGEIDVTSSSEYKRYACDPSYSHCLDQVYYEYQYLLPLAAANTAKLSTKKTKSISDSIEEGGESEDSEDEEDENDEEDDVEAAENDVNIDNDNDNDNDNAVAEDAPLENISDENQHNNPSPQSSNPTSFEEDSGNGQMDATECGGDSSNNDEYSIEDPRISEEEEMQRVRDHVVSDAENQDIAHLSVAMQRCYVVLRELIHHYLSAPFCKPFSHRIEAKYYQITPHPIFLPDIQNALKEGLYQDSIFLFYNDMIIFFNNILTSFSPGHRYYQAVLKLMPYFDRLFFECVLVVDKPLTFAESCLVCRSSLFEGKFAICERCEGHFHIECLDPPLATPPRVEWWCPYCVENRSINDVHPYRHATVSHKSLQGTGNIVRIRRVDDRLCYDVNFPSLQLQETWNGAEVRSQLVGVPAALPSGYNMDDYDAVCAIAMAYNSWSGFHHILPPVFTEAHSRAVASRCINRDSDRDGSFQMNRLRTAIACLCCKSTSSRNFSPYEYLVVFQALVQRSLALQPIISFVGNELDGILDSQIQEIAKRIRAKSCSFGAIMNPMECEDNESENDKSELNAPLSTSDTELKKTASRSGSNQRNCHNRGRLSATKSNRRNEEDFDDVDDASTISDHSLDNEKPSNKSTARKDRWNNRNLKMCENEDGDDEDEDEDNEDENSDNDNDSDDSDSILNGFEEFDVNQEWNSKESFEEWEARFQSRKRGKEDAIITRGRILEALLELKQLDEQEFEEFGESARQELGDVFSQAENRVFKACTPNLANLEDVDIEEWQRGYSAKFGDLHLSDDSMQDQTNQYCEICQATEIFVGSSFVWGQTWDEFDQHMKQEINAPLKIVWMPVGSKDAEVEVVECKKMGIPIIKGSMCMHECCAERLDSIRRSAYLQVIAKEDITIAHWLYSIGHGQTSSLGCDNMGNEYWIFSGKASVFVHRRCSIGSNCEVESTTSLSLSERLENKLKHHNGAQVGEWLEFHDKSDLVRLYHHLNPAVGQENKIRRALELLFGPFSNLTSSATDNTESSQTLVTNFCNSLADLLNTHCNVSGCFLNDSTPRVGDGENTSSVSKQSPVEKRCCGAIASSSSNMSPPMQPKDELDEDVWSDSDENINCKNTRSSRKKQVISSDSEDNDGESDMDVDQDKMSRESSSETESEAGDNSLDIEIGDCVLVECEMNDLLFEAVVHDIVSPYNNDTRFILVKFVDFGDDRVCWVEAFKVRRKFSSPEDSMCRAMKNRSRQLYLENVLFHGPDVLRTLNAYLFSHAPFRMFIDRPPLSFSNVSSSFECLRYGLLLVESALPQGCLEESEDRWQEGFEVPWRKAVLAASQPLELMQCLLVLENGFKTPWLKNGMKLMSSMPSRVYTLRYCTLDMIALKLWILDQSISYDMAIFPGDPEMKMRSIYQVKNGRFHSRKRK